MVTMKIPFRPAALLPVAALIVALAPAVRAADDAKRVLNVALDKHEKRLEGIAGFTVVQETMGFQVTTEFETVTVDGHPQLRVKGEAENPAQEMGMMYSHLREMSEHAELDGTEQVDGRECWKIRVDDLKMFEGTDTGEASSDFKPDTGWFFLDRDEYLMRRMVVEGEGTRDGRVIPVTMQLDLQDYREVDGLIYPFRTTIVIDGISADISEEDLAEARQALEEMEKQMAEMPAEQRKMMESMMGPQMERLEKMATSGKMEMEVAVKDLQVQRI
jgi:hypothetical protein